MFHTLRPSYQSGNPLYRSVTSDLDVNISTCVGTCRSPDAAAKSNRLFPYTSVKNCHDSGQYYFYYYYWLSISRMRVKRRFCFYSILVYSRTPEGLTNDHPHQRPSLSYDHISCDGQWFLFVYESLTSDHPSYTTTPM